MEREVLESIGTDYDSPRPQYSRVPVGDHFQGNKRSFLAAAPHQTMQRDMEWEIHEVERVAYCAVLRAFKAQSDALTWEKESLITELRKELRVSDDEHRELLAEVNADDLIRIIKEWREGTGHRNVATNVARHANNQVTGPTVSASRKRPRTSLSGNPFGTPSQSFHPHSVAAITQPPPSTARRGPTSGTGGQRSNTGRHSLVYDSNTQNATMDWVNINEVPHEDIWWVGEDSIPSQLGEVGVPNPGRGRALSTKQFANEIQPSGNDVIKDSGVIEIFHTSALIKKVEKLLDASHPDELEFKKAKKLLKEHEQTLIQVIAKLAEACDSDGEHPFMHGHSSGRQRRVGYQL